MWGPSLHLPAGAQPLKNLTGARNTEESDVTLQTKRVHNVHNSGKSGLFLESNVWTH